MKKIRKSNTYDWVFDSNGTTLPLEIYLLKQVNDCKGVVKLLDVYETDTCEYTMVLEFMEDWMTLSKCISILGPMDEYNAKLIFKSIIDAVRQCYQKGIFHRDLKEDNIMISCVNHQVKLIDFGLSALVQDSPYCDNPGTAGFMSPEMMDVSRRYDGMPATVYSL